MKQRQLFKVDIYLHLQLYHQRIELNVVLEEKLHGHAFSLS